MFYQFHIEFRKNFNISRIILLFKETEAKCFQLSTYVSLLKVKSTIVRNITPLKQSIVKFVDVDVFDHFTGSFVDVDNIDSTAGIIFFKKNRMMLEFDRPS